MGLPCTCFLCSRGMPFCVAYSHFFTLLPPPPPHTSLKQFKHASHTLQLLLMPWDSQSVPWASNAKTLESDKREWWWQWQQPRRSLSSKLQGFFCLTPGEIQTVLAWLKQQSGGLSFLTTMVSRKESKTQKKQTPGARITSTASAQTDMRRFQSKEGYIFLSWKPGPTLLTPYCPTVEKRFWESVKCRDYCGKNIHCHILSGFGLLAVPIFHFLPHLSSSEKGVFDRCTTASSSPLTVKI